MSNRAGAADEDVPRELVWRAWAEPEHVKKRKEHEEMGFHEGSGKALDQLVALVKTM